MQVPQWILDVAAVSGGLVAIVTLGLGVLEYRRQNALKRAEHFGKLRETLKSNNAFRAICELLEDDDPALQDVPFADKRDFLGYFEEVAISLNSGLIRLHVAQYMFGYYAIRCEDSIHFWNTVNKDALPWTLFRNFAGRMKSLEASSSYSPRFYRY